MSEKPDTTAPDSSGATTILPQQSFTLRQFSAIAGVLLLGAVVFAILETLGYYTLPYYFHFLRFVGSYWDGFVWHITHPHFAWHWHHSA